VNCVGETALHCVHHGRSLGRNRVRLVLLCCRRRGSNGMRGGRSASRARKTGLILPPQYYPSPPPRCATSAPYSARLFSRMRCASIASWWDLTRAVRAPVNSESLVGLSGDFGSAPGLWGEFRGAIQHVRCTLRRRTCVLRDGTVERAYELHDEATKIGVHVVGATERRRRRPRRFHRIVSICGHVPRPRCGESA
jgi:hypothetical protein